MLPYIGTRHDHNLGWKVVKQNWTRERAKVKDEEKKQSEKSTHEGTKSDIYGFQGWETVVLQFVILQCTHAAFCNLIGSPIFISVIINSVPRCHFP